MIFEGCADVRLYCCICYTDALLMSFEMNGYVILMLGYATLCHVV